MFERRVIVYPPSEAGDSGVFEWQGGVPELWAP